MSAGPSKKDQQAINRVSGKWEFFKPTPVKVSAAALAGLLAALAAW